MNQQDKKEETKNYSIPVLFLRQSDGKPSASFTIMFLTFNAILIWLLLSIFEGIGQIKVRAFDAGQAMTLFTPLAALYFGRRYTDGVKIISNNITKQEQKEKPKSDPEID